MADPSRERVAAPHLAATTVAGVHLDGEHAADRPVVGEPRLAPQVLQLLDAVAVPQYPVAPTLARKSSVTSLLDGTHNFQMTCMVPCRRSPFLLGLDRLAGVCVRVVCVLVRGREADLVVLPSQRKPSAYVSIIC